MTELGLVYRVLKRRMMRLPLFLKGDDYLSVSIQRSAISYQRKVERWAAKCHR